MQTQDTLTRNTHKTEKHIFCVEAQQIKDKLQNKHKQINNIRQAQFYLCVCFLFFQTEHSV